MIRVSSRVVGIPNGQFQKPSKDNWNGSTTWGVSGTSALKASSVSPRKISRFQRLPGLITIGPGAVPQAAIVRAFGAQHTLEVHSPAVGWISVNVEILSFN